MALPLTTEEKLFAKKMIQVLVRSRQSMARYEQWKPTREILARIDDYLTDLDRKWETHGPKSGQPITETEMLGDENWIDRLTTRVKEEGLITIGQGAKLLRWVGSKAKTIYTKCRDWAIENPGKAVLIAWFGVPVAIETLIKATPVFGAVATTATALALSKTALKIVARTAKEEIIDPATTLLWVAAGIGIIYLFKEELFGTSEPMR